MTLLATPRSMNARERIRQQIARHVRAVVSEAISSRVPPDEAVDRLVCLVDLYAGHAATVERSGDA